MQVVMKKCFLLNPEKNFGTDPSCRFREKSKIAPLIPKNYVTKPKARLLGPKVGNSIKCLSQTQRRTTALRVEQIFRNLSIASSALYQLIQCNFVELSNGTLKM